MSKYNMQNLPDKGFTHGGKFHSDDVLATAFLRILNPKITIERGFDVPENFDGIVYDIGRGEFDHHQQDKEYRENGCPYAAFGLIWRAFGADFIGEEEAVHFDEKFIQPLDESDNTGCDNMLAKVIGEFNPGWDSTESYEDCFWKAEAMAEVILRNHFESVEGAKRGSALVKEAMERSDGKILILPRFAPWKKEVTGSSYLFTIYPSNRGGYSVQAVPVSNEDTTLVCPFPDAWCGKTKEELVALTGIASLRFCHPNGFLCAAEKLEDAVCVAKKAMELKKKD